MNYPGPLHKGVLLRRCQRFLADVQAADGSALTIHCPNTGSMLGCREPGSRVWYTASGNPKRKYPHTWQIVEVEGRHLVGINTGMANPLVAEAIAAGLVEPLAGHVAIKRETMYRSGNGRADFLVSLPAGECFVEVKNVSLAEPDGTGLFPDAVTERGQRHLRELIALRSQGTRAMVIFCIAHDGVHSLRPADRIDQDFGILLRQAAAAGVELLAYGASYDVRAGTVLLDRALPVLL